MIAGTTARESFVVFLPLIFSLQISSASGVTRSDNHLANLPEI